QRGDDIHIYVEDGHQRPRVGYVLHQDSLAWISEVLVRKLSEWNPQKCDTAADQLRIERPGGIVEDVAVFAHFANIFRVGLRVHRDHQIVVQRAGRISFVVDPNLVPGGKSLDVGWKKILPGNRNPHAKN